MSPKTPRAGTSRKGGAPRGSGSTRTETPASGSAEKVSRARFAVACLAVAAAALAVGLPTLHYSFLSWDDSAYVTENPWIRAWTAENLVHIFTKPHFVSYMPLQLVSYMVDYRFWGLDPFGYHFQEVALHTLDTVLALVLVWTLFGRFWMALLAGILFAVHPSHVEAIAWVSARKDVLSAAFLLPSIALYLRARAGRGMRRGPYLASLGLFALAVLARVNVIVAPLFLLLVDAFDRQRERWSAKKAWSLVGNKVPYLVIGSGIALVNWVVQPKSHAALAGSAFHYLALKGEAAWRYLALLTGIPRQNPIYDTPEIALDASAFLALGSLVLLPLLFWFAYRRRDRVLALGAGWIFVMLLPALFFPVLTFIADRYLYLPSLGFCWLLAAGIVWLGRRVPRPVGPAVSLLLIAALVLFFAGRSLAYNKIWRDSESLWSYTIEASRDFRAFNNLARVRMEQNRWQDAEQLFQQGSRQSNVTSWEGLTAVYYKTGRFPEALQMADKALEMHALKGDDPIELAELTYKKGSVLLALGRTSESITALETAVRLNPRHSEARRILAIARQAASQR